MLKCLGPRLSGHGFVRAFLHGDKQGQVWNHIASKTINYPFQIIMLIFLFLIMTINAQAQKKVETLGLSYLGYNPFSKASDSALAHDIDSILYNCPDGLSRTTAGDINCYNETLAQVEKKINHAYYDLFQKLDASDRKLLEAAQNEWNGYFKAEKMFLYSSFHTWANKEKYGHGREHSIAQAEWLFKIARQRLVALRVFTNEIY